MTSHSLLSLVETHFNGTVSLQKKVLLGAVRCILIADIGFMTQDILQHLQSSSSCSVASNYLDVSLVLLEITI